MTYSMQCAETHYRDYLLENETFFEKVTLSKSVSHHKRAKKMESDLFISYDINIYLTTRSLLNEYNNQWITVQ